MEIKLVGEIGINHNGDLAIAKKLIDIAAYANFDYVKFQKRKIDLFYSKEELATLRKSIFGETNGDLKRGLEFSEEQYKEISDYCKLKDIGWFASVWDMKSAELMTKFTDDLIKIPSPIITNLKILEFCRNNFKRVMISTGMSTQEEIDDAVRVGKPDIIMHSVSVYPTSVSDLNLQYIISLMEKYPEKEIGYSGHEVGIDFLPYILGRGVKWIEKHITLSKDLWGSDQRVSIDPEEIFRLSRITRHIREGIGGMYNRYLLPNEMEAKKKLRR